MNPRCRKVVSTKNIKQLGGDLTYRKHFISLVQDEHFHVVSLEHASLDHVLNPSWSSNNDLWAILECLHVFADIGSTDTCVAFNTHEIANSDNDLLDLLSKLTGGCEDESLAGLEVGIDFLEAGDGERRGFSSARLGLGNHIRSLGFVSGRQINQDDENVPLMTGMIARCWIADGRSKP